MEHTGRVTQLYDLSLIAVAPMGDDTAAIVQLGRLDWGRVLVSEAIARRYRTDAALHALTHRDEALALGDTAARCARSTCPVAATWLPIVLTDVASGL